MRFCYTYGSIDMSKARCVCQINCRRVWNSILVSGWASISDGDVNGAPWSANVEMKVTIVLLILEVKVGTAWDPEAGEDRVCPTIKGNDGVCLAR